MTVAIFQTDGLLMLLGLIWRPLMGQDSAFLLWLVVVLFLWGASGVLKRW